MTLWAQVHIGLVGKYVKLHDAYLSVAEAMNHAGYELNTFVKIHWIDSENIRSDNVKEILEGLDGIIVPGGFGNRGIEGMILSANYARENQIPYFGICLGMQIAVIEFARNVLGLSTADHKSCSHQFLTIFIIKLIAMAMALMDQFVTIALFHFRSWICRKDRSCSDIA